MKAWITTRRIKVGSEEEFRRRWAGDKTPRGMTAAWLLQDEENPRESLSVSLWEDAGDLYAYRTSEEHRRRQEAIGPYIEQAETSKVYNAAGAEDLGKSGGTSKKAFVLPALVGGAGAGAWYLTRRMQQPKESVVEKSRRTVVEQSSSKRWFLLPAVAAPVAAAAFFLVKKLRGGSEESEQTYRWQGEAASGRHEAIRIVPASDQQGGAIHADARSSRPAVSRGAREGLLVHDVMTANPETVAHDDDLATAAAKMRDLNVGVLPVMADGALAGIITDRDLALGMAEGSKEAGKSRVRDLMTDTPVTIHPSMSAEEAARLMAEHQVRRLPVVDGTKLVGIVSLGDLATDGPANAAESALHDISEPAQPQR